MSRRCWSVVVMAACASVIKPPEPDRRLDIRVNGTAFESDRGYRFAVLPELGAKVMRLDVRYPVGTADDPPGKEGLAHLVEHLLGTVEITRDGKKTSIDAEQGRLAFSSNAFTTPDYTQYYVLAAPEALEDLLGLEVERLAVGCAGLTREIFAREREVVLNELRQRQGASGADLARLVYNEVYPDKHPYRAVDSVDSVSRIQFEDVCAFLVGPYRRGPAIVAVSGAVTDSRVRAAAGKHFGRAPKLAITSRPVPVAAQPRPGLVRVRGDVDEPTLLVTWPLPSMTTREYRLLELAWSVIAFRLEAFAFTYGWGNTGSTVILGGTHAPVLAVGIHLNGTSHLDEAISSVEKSVQYALRVLYRPGDDHKTAGWVRRWEERAERLLARWDTLAGRNDLFADFMMFEKGDSLVARIEELAEATPIATRELAARWLSSSRARHILIEPTGTTRVGRSANYVVSTKEPHGIHVDGAAADSPLPMPVLTTLRREPERYMLDNGLSVVLWPHGSGPVVHARLVVDSGSAHEPAGKEGVADLVGASAVYPDSVVFYDRELSNRVDELLGAIAGELRVPGYDLSDEDKEYMKGRLVQQRARERIAYARDMLVAVYGDGHPYARTSMTEDSVDNLSQDVVMKWARGHVVPKNATLIISGQFDPALVKRHITYHLDQVSSGSDSQPLESAPMGTTRWVVGTTSKPSPTVEIDVRFAGDAGIDRNTPYRVVLAQVLSSQLAGLREKQAITYGFSASYSHRLAGGIWAITGEVDAARAKEAATTLVQILQQMRSDPESYRGAFVLAREKVLEGLLVGVTSAEGMTDRLEFLARFDLSDRYFGLLADAVARMTLADLHQFFVKELAEEHQVFGAFGNEDVAMAAVAAARSARAVRGTLADPFATPAR